MSNAMQQLLNIMEQLRDKEHGCPWDVEQDFVSIAPYTIEEAYEVADAIAQGDKKALKSELGDLLLQVVFHAQMAKEESSFDFEQVAQDICDKMIRRHPHVFGNAVIDSAKAQEEAWEQQKSEERAKQGASSVLDGVALGYPALLRAYKLQKRAAKVGFDWRNVNEVFDKVREEISEIEQELAHEKQNSSAIEEEVGDLLFAVVNLARKLGIEPENALRLGNAKFEKRFHFIESELAKDMRAIENSNLDEMEALWQKAKLLAKKTDA